MDDFLQIVNQAVLERARSLHPKFGVRSDYNFFQDRIQIMLYYGNTVCVVLRMPKDQSGIEYYSKKSVWIAVEASDPSINIEKLINKATDRTCGKIIKSRKTRKTPLSSNGSG
jgi:hypothetical protein